MAITCTENRKLINSPTCGEAPLPDRCLYLGRSLPLTVEKNFCKPGVRFDGETMRVNQYAGSLDSDPLDLLRRWYYAEAKRILTQKTAMWSRQIGVQIGKISVKDQKTRWGSCSTLGNVNYNWRIVMAPDETIDYLVVHEVAHRIHMNHASDFWKLVALYCPDYNRHRLWLKQNGRTLFRQI